MSTAVPTTGWSATITLIAGAEYTYTATPGTGGSMRVQWSDGTNWFDFSNNRVSAVTTGQVPPAAVALRAQAFGVAGTLEETRETFAGAVSARHVPIFLEDLDSPPADMLADTSVLYELQVTGKPLYRSNGTTLELVSLPRNQPRWAVMGDSIAAQHITINATSNFLNAKGIVTRLNARAGWPAMFTTADSYSGNGANTEAMLTPTVGQLDRLLAQHVITPYTKCFVIVGTNDNGNGLTFAQTTANLAAIFQRLISADITPVYFGILPRGNDAAITTGKQSQMRVNAWAEEYAAQNPQVEFIDGGKYIADNAATYGAGSDSAGNVIASMCYDSVLHPTDAGAEMVAEAAWEYYQAKGGLGASLVVPRTRQGDKFNVTNNPFGVCFKSPNPLMIGITGTKSGTATGDVPDGMIGTNGTWSKGTQTLPNGLTIPTAICELTGTTACHLLDDVTATGSLDSEGIFAGDVIEAICVAKFTDLVAAKSIIFRVSVSDGTTTVLNEIGNQDGTNPSIQPFTGSKTFKFLQRITVPPYSGSGNMNISVSIRSTLNTATAGQFMEVLCLQMYKVPTI